MNQTLTIVIGCLIALLIGLMLGGVIVFLVLLYRSIANSNRSSESLAKAVEQLKQVLSEKIDAGVAVISSSAAQEVDVVEEMTAALKAITLVAGEVKTALPNLTSAVDTSGRRSVAVVTSMKELNLTFGAFNKMFFSEKLRASVEKDEFARDGQSSTAAPTDEELADQETQLAMAKAGLAIDETQENTPDPTKINQAQAY